MPKVKQVVAAKDYPSYGIKKGEKHYYWKAKTGPRSSRTYRQTKPPTRSQLTQSAFYQAVYSLFDDSKPECPADLRAMAESLREIGQEEQDKLSNMPDNLQESDTGQMLQERADACESSADELESLADEWENAEDRVDLDPQDYLDRVSECEPCP